VDLIEADGDTLKIEQVRDMQHSLSLLPVEARYRVIILRHFHKASPQAMDALLKTLEEPPPYVLLLLTADTTDSLLPTIRSRCQPLNLRLLPPATIRQALEKDHKVAPEQVALVAQLSGGRMGWAVRATADETLLADRNNWLAKLEESLGLSRAGRFALAEPLSKDKSALLALLEIWQSYWRDALLLAQPTSRITTATAATRWNRSQSAFGSRRFTAS
jgi:DNA polymerase-3 subunit delta'